MGMSSSQSRLLSLTARMHDIEYKAQNIENQKISLATQRDELYQAYCDALDAKKIQVAYNGNDGTRNYVDANYANICTYDPLRSQQYALKDADTGKAIVPKEVYEMYKTNGFSNDKYAFAWAMLGLDLCTQDYEDSSRYNNLEHEYRMLGVNTDATGGEFAGSSSTAVSKLMTSIEQAVYDEIIVNDDVHGLQKLYDKFWETDKSEECNSTEKWKAFNEFRSALYKYYGQDIYDKMQQSDNASSATEWDDISGEYNYYVNLFEEIQNCGGCICIDDFSNGAITDNEWFNNVVTSGRVLIDMYNAKNGWIETSVATSTTENYLQEVADEVDLKKAEAEYEYELGKINQKDTKFDKDLSKLETERTSLKTEMDSLKTIISDNTERTFNLFN